MKKTRSMLAVIVVLIICCTTIFAACSQDKVTISKSTASVAVGDTVTLTAEASNGGEISWSSSNTAVATVNNGVVTGVSAGTAKITATSGKASAECTVTVTEGTVTEDGNYISLEDYRAYSIHDLDLARSAIGSVSTEVDAQVTAAYNSGKSAINSAANVGAVKKALSAGITAMMNCVPLANGVFDFSGLSNEDKTELLGIMEAFAIKAGLTGTTMFENGRYQIYRDRVTLGTENYINGYGFGTLAEGSLTADLDSETNAAWKRYYHTITAENPNSANYLDSQASTVGDMYSYIGGALFTNFMNETKDGYVWTPELAVSDPEPVGTLNGAGQTTTWKIELRKDLKYNTLGKYTQYNGRAVELEDFLTPYKLLLNKANAYYRGSELASATGASSIQGAAAYYKASGNINKVGILTDEELNLSKLVGVSVKEEDGKWYFQYTLGAPVNAFFARYYINSSLYMPIPADFIAEVGPKAYLGFDSDKNTTPVDNSLSLGAYTFEVWQDTQIVLKKNPYYVHAADKYAIQGVHINVLTAAQTDREAAIKEFEAGKIDACSIPDTYLDRYKDNPRTRKTIGDSCFKLNFNALNATDWEKLFGENGTVLQNTKDNYWAVEPAMSNAHFRSALSYAMNRLDYADAKGYMPSVDFFSPNYMSDPENGIYYYTTQAHKDAIASIVDEDTDAYGYSLQLARDYFRMALDELEASGAYTPGTAANPTIINLQIAWQTSSDENDHKFIKQYWEDAFNHESVSGGKYKLNVEFWVGNTWMDVYNEKMLVGQFDIGMGSISGNELDPLAFFNVLSTDMSISNNFTLNWAIDTSDPNAGVLVYKGMRWSWDALYKSYRQPSIVVDGRLESAVKLSNSESKIDGENTVITVTVKLANSSVKLDEIDIVAFAGGSSASDPYNEFSIIEYASEPVISSDGLTYTYTLTVPTSVLKADLPGSPRQGIDFYAGYTLTTASGPVVSPLGYLESAEVALFTVAE